jgi:diguanylate cyclase (GGDEF)-like protein
MPEAISIRAIFGPGAARVPVLVVLNGPQLGERRRLDGVVEIGRDPHAGLVLRDPEVAWRHVRISPTVEGWTLVAMDSQQGVQVNGNKVHTRVLAEDDTIMLGSTVLRFEFHDPIEQAFDAAVEERVWRDDLTGLYSRRKFELELAARLDAATLEGKQVGLAVIDLDRLKAINDRYGHGVGAQVIAAVGRAIGEALPDGAFACRLGGDEFAIVLPGGIEKIETLATELIGIVSATRVRHGEHELSVGMSAGLAVGPDQGRDPVLLMRAADDALLRAKREGRGRIVRS